MKDIDMSDSEKMLCNDFENYCSRAWLEDEQSYRSTGYIYCCEFKGGYEVRLADCYGAYSIKGTTRGRKTFCKSLDSIINVLNRKSSRKMIRSSILYRHFIKFNKSAYESSVTVYTKQKQSGHEKTIIEIHQLNGQDEAGFYRKLDRISNELEKFKAHILYCVNK